jgi:anti-sigma factor ChrR (cupin superfamily)
MPEHLDIVSLARYLGGAGTSDERTRCEAHLSECPDCREEMVEVRRILATAPSRRRVSLVPLAAAAAVLLLVWTGIIDREPVGDATRDSEAPPTLALAPRPLAPLGRVSRLDGLLWSAVPGVARYRVTLFTSEGRAAWQITTTDTFVALPDTLHLAVATPHYWQVKAETGYGRWVESELVAFTMPRPDAPQ